MTRSKKQQKQQRPSRPVARRARAPATGRTRTSRAIAVVPSTYHYHRGLKRQSRGYAQTIAVREVSRKLYTPVSLGTGWTGVDYGIMVHVEADPAYSRPMGATNEMFIGAIDNNGNSTMSSYNNWQWTQPQAGVAGLGAYGRTVSASISITYTGPTLANQGILYVWAGPPPEEATTRDELAQAVKSSPNTVLFSMKELRAGRIVNIRELSEENADRFVGIRTTAGATDPPSLESGGTSGTKLNGSFAPGYFSTVIYAEGMDVTGRLLFETVRHLEIIPSAEFQHVATPPSRRALANTPGHVTARSEAATMAETGLGVGTAGKAAAVAQRSYAASRGLRTANMFRPAIADAADALALV